MSDLELDNPGELRVEAPYEGKKYSSEEISRTLFDIWLKSEIRVKRREYKVPARISALPCGCRRERSFEGDANADWRIKRDDKRYYHKECGQTVLKITEGGHQGEQ